MALKEKAEGMKKKIIEKVNNVANNVANKMKINIPRDQTNDEIKETKLGNQVLFFIFLLIGILLLGAILLVSRIFRVYMSLAKLAIYRTNEIKQQNLTDYISIEDINKKKLRDFYIASAYRPYVCGLHKFDYVSVEVFIEVLKCGPRFVELEIFNSGYGEDVEPVVSVGEEEGEWKYTLNSINLKLFLREIAKVAFNLKDLKVYKDPFILYLNLKTNRNVRCLNKVHKYIYEILGEYLLDSKYAYNSPNKETSDINDITIGDCLGKVLIFSSSGFEDTNLEEVVNYSSASNYTLQNNKNQYRILYVRHEDVVDAEEDIEDYSNEEFHKLSGNDLKRYNKCGFTILSPEIKTDSIFSGITPINYEPGKGLDWGCQFIMMNYQKIDTNMSNYAYIFKDSSFVLKSDIYETGEEEKECKKFFTGERMVYKDKEQKEINYIYTKT
jgi:hypothetical protein